MNVIRFVCVLAVSVGLACVVQASEPEVIVPVRLSRSTAAPVVELELFAATSRTNKETLAIYADGRAVVSVAGIEGRQVQGRIPSHELRTLFNDLLVEHNLLDCQTRPMQESIRRVRRERQRPDPGPDAATTIIRVRMEADTHEVHCHALGLTASQLPDLRGVRDLFACQQRLQNVAAVIRAGGYEQIQTVLAAANGQLKLQAPAVRALTSRDLSLVDLRPDGTRYLQFSRVPDVDGLRPEGGLVMVSVYQTPGTPPEISVTADPT